jgi:hypothetical protein
MRYGLACLFGLLFSVSASAVDSTGKIRDIYTHQYTTTVFFRIEGSAITDCASSGRYAIDTTLPGGELLFSVLLSAQAIGKEIFVRGTDRCVIHADTEDVNWVRFE